MAEQEQAGPSGPVDESAPLLSSSVADEESGAGRVAGFIQMLQGNLGPGILTLPFIFTVGGVITTSVMLLVVLVTTLYAMRLVLNAKAWLHRSKAWINVKEIDRPQTFQDIGRELLGAKGEKVIIVFVVLMQLGICMVFFNYAAENIVAVEKYYLSQENSTCLEQNDDDLIGTNGLATGYGDQPGYGNQTPCSGTLEDNLALSKTEVILASIPFVLMLSLAQTATIITISTTCATCIMYVGVGTILFLVGWHFTNYYPGIDNVQLQPERPADIPIVFGNLVYTVTTAIGILLPIENGMKPSARRGYVTVVNAAMLCALVLFMSVGLLSNFAFGKQSERSIVAQFVEKNIGDATYISVIVVLLAFSVLLTFPLQFRPASQVVEMSFGLSPPTKSSNPLVLQDNEIPTTFLQRHGYLFIRSGLVFLCAGGAILVPRLDLVISLAGSFTSCVLAMMVPPSMDFATMAADGKYHKGRVVANCFVIFCGIIGLIGGTGATLLEILEIPFPGTEGQNITEPGYSNPRIHLP